MTTTIALVTGANKGIGLEIARQLGARGAAVLAGARDASVQAAADWIEAEYGRLDILVNNAGIAVRGGPPSATDLGVMREIYETNVFGVIMVTNAMLPLLRRAPAARIVNVSSEVGSITALYAKELRDTAVKVNAANPGYTKTDLNGNTGYRSAAGGAEPIVELATLGADGPSGILWGHVASSAAPHSPYAPLPW